MDPIRRFAAFMLLMGFGLGLAGLACALWRGGYTWPAIRTAIFAASTVFFALWLVRKTPRPRLFRGRDNAATSKPSRFSMRRVFVIVTIICAEAGLFFVLTNQYFGSQREDMTVAMFLIVGVSTPASWVILCKPLGGALWGAAAFIAAMVWMILCGRH
jgi:hypothetical protein